MIKLHAILNRATTEPQEETVLCDNCFTDKNKEWHELNNDGTNSLWYEFEPDFRNTENPDYTCVVCGFPIGFTKI